MDDNLEITTDPKMKYTNTKLFSNFLKEIREKYDLSTVEMAAYLDLKATTYNSIETMNTKTITYEMLIALFEFLIKKRRGSYDAYYISNYIIDELDEFYRLNHHNNLKEEYWFYALYIKHQFVPYNENLMNYILSKCSCPKDWMYILRRLNNGDYISRKTGKNIYNNVYCDKPLNNNGYPFWFVRYDLSNYDIEKIASYIYSKNGIRFEVLFSLLLDSLYQEYKGTKINFIFDKAYEMIEAEGIKHVFTITNFLNSQAATSANDNKPSINKLIDFVNNLNVEDDNFSLKILKSNLKIGEQNFLDLINISFATILSMDAQTIQSFRENLKKLVDEYSIK